MRGKVGRIGSKMSKPISAPPRGCGAIISLYPCPTTFVGWGKPTAGEVERGGSSGARQNCHPYAISVLCKCWVSMSGANLTILQDGHAIGMGQNTFPLANISLPLLIVISRVGFKPSHVSILTCLVMYKNLIRFGLFNFYT